MRGAAVFGDRCFEFRQITLLDVCPPPTNVRECRLKLSSKSLINGWVIEEWNFHFRMPTFRVTIPLATRYLRWRRGRRRGGECQERN